MAAKSVCVSDIFDDIPITALQIRVYILCLFIVLLDGFDLVVVSVALPKIGQHLHVGPSALGLAVGAGQLGPLVGAMVIGMLADRFGRKKMLIISSIIFGVFTALIATIGSVEQLALYRFLSGIGLGGAVPNALAFGCEYAPVKKRASFTTLMWSGMPLGSVLAGFAAAWMLPHYGWQSVFWLGGVVPLVITALVGPFLPESLTFLLRHGSAKQRLLKIVSKVAPNLGADRDTEFYSKENKLAGVPLKHLFSEGRTSVTVGIWALFFLSFYLLWVLLSWTPTLLKSTGASVQQYSIAYAFFNMGSFLAAIIIGRLMDKFSLYHVLEGWFVMAFFTVSAFGIFAHRGFLTATGLAIVTGMFVNGGNTGLLALCTLAYPTSIRGSGVGWAYGVGKVGSMLGPIIGGFLLALSWSVGKICVVNGLVSFVIVAIVVALGRSAAMAKASAAPEAAKAVAAGAH